MSEVLNGWHPDLGCMNLDQFRTGITIPEYSVTIPWLVSRRSLFRYIPKKHFRMVCGGPLGIPAIRFSCMGVTGEFAFDFHSHPDSKLDRIQMMVDDNPISTTATGVPTALLNTIGEPIQCDTHCFCWFDRFTIIDCWVAIARRQPYEPKIYSYSRLDIYHNYEMHEVRWRNIVVNPA